MCPAEHVAAPDSAVDPILWTRRTNSRSLGRPQVSLFWEDRPVRLTGLFLLRRTPVSGAPGRDVRCVASRVQFNPSSSRKAVA